MPDFRTRSELFYAHRAEQRDLYLTVLFGLALITLSIYEYKSGRVWEKFFGWVSKEESPWVFWAEVSGAFVAGIGVIAYAAIRLWQMTPS